MGRTQTVLFVCVFIFSAHTFATLIDNGDGTVTDTTTQLMWLKDANLPGTQGFGDGSMHWDDAHAWVDQLEYAGYSDWRLPAAGTDDTADTCTGFGCNTGELGKLFLTSLDNRAFWWPGFNSGPFINVQNEQLSSGYWYQDTHADDPLRAWDFWIYGGFQGDNLKSETLFVWAVRSLSQTIAVNEPATVIYGFTLLLLLGLFRRRNSDVALSKAAIP